MEFHIQCDPDDIARYVFCPGSHSRARKIAEHFDDMHLVSETRGYHVYSGTYQDVPMTSIGTGMGGPTVAIGLEELWHMGADTFIRVGSCGVFQPEQGPGDIIISSGSYRMGGTANQYLPTPFPAVPTFTVLRALVAAADDMEVDYTVGIGITTDAFYLPLEREFLRKMVNAGLVSIEMENDTLFVIGAFRGWRTGSILTSDGAPGNVKPESGVEAFREGEVRSIQIALQAMLSLARADGK